MFINGELCLCDGCASVMERIPRACDVTGSFPFQLCSINLAADALFLACPLSKRRFILCKIVKSINKRGEGRQRQINVF